MAVTMNNGPILLLLVTALVAVVSSASISTHAENAMAGDAVLNKQLRGLIERRKELAFARAIMEELDQHLAQIHQRTCDINLPGFECSGGAIDAGSDGWYWGSDHSPGKRKRACALNLNDGSCDNKHVIGLVSDLNTWMNGPGKRRR